MLSWGSNSRGQRGWGGPEIAREAGQAELPNLCTQIAAGNEHSLALDVDGAVWAWGDNAHGELGSEGGVSGKPIRVPLGGGHALSIAAVRRGRGSNPRELPCPDDTGVARRGEGERERARPALTPARAALQGRDFSLALVRPRVAGAPPRVWSWGSNTSGQLAQPEAPPRSMAGGPAPLPFVLSASNRSAARVACGPSQGLVLDGAATYAWGEGRDGLLGSPRAAHGTPLQLGGLAGQRLLDVSLGDTHAAAVGEGGALFTWGAPPLLAEEAAEARLLPARALEPSRLYNFSSVACGSSHCVATARCNVRIDLCGVCGGDDSTCFLGGVQLAQALQMSATLEKNAAST